jgi:ribosomal protein S18 acetylase RimI-like enzyme
MPIRNAQNQDQNDYAFITELAQEFDIFGPYGPVFQNLFHNQPDSFLIYENDEYTRIGFAQIQWIGNVGDIQGIAVVPAYRRQGVAGQLLAQILIIANNRRATSLQCITAQADNEPALKFFTRHGFINRGVAGQYPKHQIAVKLVRQLI